MAVPMVEAITALRNCALWSDSDNVPWAIATLIDMLPLIGCFPCPVLPGSLGAMLQSVRGDRKTQSPLRALLLHRMKGGEEPTMTPPGSSAAFRSPGAPSFNQTRKCLESLRPCA